MLEAGQPWGGSPSSLPSCLLRIPLHKGKSIRKALREHGLLEDFLRTHQYTASGKYRSGKVASEPLFNYLDVSGSPPPQGATDTPSPTRTPPPPLSEELSVPQDMEAASLALGQPRAGLWMTSFLQTTALGAHCLPHPASIRDPRALPHWGSVGMGSWW